MVRPRPRIRLVTAHMTSSRKTSLPAMRSRSLAREEMTPVIEKAPISRPQPARMAISSTKVLPLTSRNSTHRRAPQFLPGMASLSTIRRHAPQHGMGDVVPQHRPGQADGCDQRCRVGKPPGRRLRPLMQDDEQRRGIERRVALALEVQQHDHEQHDDEQVVPALLDGIAEARQLGARNALEPVARGVAVDLHEQADVVEHRRNGRGQRHLGVADVHELRHDEGRGAHDRRRQHGAGGGARLDGGGIGRAKAGLLHHRDGHGAGGQHVRHDAAADRAEQAAGENARPWPRRRGTCRTARTTD